MKVHRFILEFTGDKITDKEFVNQVHNVLKLKKGEQIILTDGKMKESLVEIVELNKSIVEVRILKTYQNENEPRVDVTLYCSILKRENFEWVVQKATEIGVKEIVPIISKRTVKLNLNQERLEKIAKEAVEQSGRGMVPVMKVPMHFEQALEDAKKNEVNVFFDASGERIVDLAGKKRIGLFIGPEGGWDEKELELAKNNGYIIANLGKLTLRGETAAMVAAYKVLSMS